MKITYLNSLERHEHSSEITRVSEDLGPDVDGNDDTFNDREQVREFLPYQ
jgi:hypothetical protein